MLSRKLLKLIDAFRSKQYYRPYKTSASTYNGNDVLKAYKHGTRIIDELTNEIRQLENRLEKYETKKTPLLCRFGFHDIDYKVDENKNTIRCCTRCSHKVIISTSRTNITSGTSFVFGNPYTWTIETYPSSSSTTSTYYSTNGTAPTLAVIENNKVVKNTKKSKKKNNPKLEIVK